MKRFGARLAITITAISMPAGAYSRELVVNLDAATEVLPDRVCIAAERVADDMGWHKAPMQCDGASSNPFHSCKPPHAEFFTVCSSPSASAGGRELYIQLEHARVERLEGFESGAKTLRLSLDLAEGARLTPSLEVLGGSYHHGAIESAHRAQVVTFSLLPRFVKRPIRYPNTSGPSCSNEIIFSNGHMMPAPSYGEVLLLIGERGRENSLVVDRCGTRYSAKYAYPPPDFIPLGATTFEVHWRKSCFAVGGSLQGCPDLALVRYGKQCKCTGATCASAPAGQVCRYTCEVDQPAEFPTPVRITAIPNTGQSNAPRSVDSLVWEEDVRYPGDELNGFVDAESRRVFLRWSKDNGTSPAPAAQAPTDWTTSGEELDAVEITAPDGRTHRISSDALAVAVPGVQCGDRFSYRYLGRWPHDVQSNPIVGDTLQLDDPAEARQDIVLGLRAHGGALYYAGLDARAAWSPFFDVELAALVFGGWDLAVSGIFSEHPSSSQFADQEEAWEFSALARVLAGGARTFYFTRGYASAGIALGIAFPALASSWNEAEEYPIAALRIRAAYEITRSIAAELGLWGLFPEQYLVSRQDAYGPVSVESKLTAVIGMSGGLQWSDVF
jgi:hypothetical protein